MEEFLKQLLSMLHGICHCPKHAGLPAYPALPPVYPKELVQLRGVYDKFKGDFEILQAGPEDLEKLKWIILQEVSIDMLNTYIEEKNGKIFDLTYDLEGKIDEITRLRKRNADLNAIIIEMGRNAPQVAERHSNCS